MAIILNDNIKINAGKPSEAKYLNPNTNVPYSNTTEVNTLVPISERHRGLTVLINDLEYWYKDGVTNSDLILKSLGGSGSGERIEYTFTQPSHGFTGGTVVEYSGGTFIKALAIAGRNSEVVGLVSDVVGDDFTVIFSGYVADSSSFKNYSGSTLSPNTTYYLSSNVAGGLTSIEPTIPTTISKPMFTTLTGGDGVVFQYRGIINTTGSTGGNTSGFTSAGNFGSGEEIYDNVIPSLLKFRTLKSGNNISVSTIGDEILFNFTGQSFNAGSGLSVDGSTIVLGGALTGDTTIDASGNTFLVKDGDTGTTLSSFELKSSGITSVYNVTPSGLKNKFYIGGSVDDTLVIPRHETVWYVERELQSISLISIDDIDGIKLKSTDNLGNTPAQISIDINEIKISGNSSTFAGAQYAENYVSNFTQRSLVDKGYVDAVASGLDPKESAHLATTGPLTGATYLATGGTSLTGRFTGAPSVVDGHPVTIGDRILVKDQVDLKQNGLYYLVSGSTWYRTQDQDGTPANEVSTGNYVFVTTGDTYSGTGWVIIGTGSTLTLNTDPIEWAQFSSSVVYMAGNGIDITGQLISVDLAANSGLFVDSFGLKVDSSIAGNGLTLTSGVLDVDVENGLSISNGKVVLGGTLTGATTINALDTSNRLSFGAFPVQYVADYSSNFTPRSLVDKAYVTGLTSSIVIPVTGASNGLSLVSGNVELGGSLTNNTIINATGSTTLTFNVDNSPFNITGALKIGGSFGTLDVDSDDPTFGYSQLLVKPNEISNYHEHYNGTDFYWVKAGNSGVELNSTYDYQDSAILYLDNPVPNFPEFRLETYDDANAVQNVEALKINKSGFTTTLRNNSDVEIVRFTINSGSTKYFDTRPVTTGIQYGGNYSAGFTARSLVDKGYVTGLTTSLAVTANNGLTKSGNNIRLGGALTGTTSISAGVNDLNIGVTSGKFRVSGSSSQFYWDAANRRLIAGNGTITGGTENINFGAGGTVMAGSWSFTSAEESHIRAGAGNSISAGYFHIVGNGVGFSGNGSATFGVNNLNYGLGSHLSGIGGKIEYLGTSQRGGFVHAFQRGSINGLKPTDTPYLLANDGAFNVGRNDASQVDGHGALAQDSAILGGINHNIPSNSLRSAIIGGNGIKATSATTDTVFMPKLRIGLGSGTTMVTNNSNDNILVRNSTTGEIEIRNASAITTSLNVYTQKVTITANYTATTTNHVIFCNTTSGGFTVTLPASPVDGQVYKIKDVGNAFLNNITISGNGNNIDGSATAIINTQRGGFEICYDQTLDEWMILNFVG